MIGVGGSTKSRPTTRLNRPFSRAAHLAPSWPADEVLWGIARRPQHSDLDDPSAHRGRIQHAFLLGNDSKALCGFNPRRPGDGLGSPLAVPSPVYNPMCPRCSAMVSAPTGRVILPRLDPRPAVAFPIRTSPAVTVAPFAQPPDVISVTAPTAVPPVEDTPWQALEVEPPTRINLAIVPYDERMADPFAGSMPVVRREPARATTARPRARRRSVRKGGTLTAMPGASSMTLEVPALADGASVVAHVAEGVTDVRVSAVAIIGNTTASIEFDRPVTRQTDVVWFIVSPVRTR